MTGYCVRTEVDGKWQAVEVDHLTDDQLDFYIAQQRAAGGDGWRWMKELAKWIRDNVTVRPTADSPAPNGG